MQFSKELRPPTGAATSSFTSLNEVQFPKELRPANRLRRDLRVPGLNEVQFPKELRLVVNFKPEGRGTSLTEVQLPMVLRPPVGDVRDGRVTASMKCSSRRNCDGRVAAETPGQGGLNEVQFPKKLRRQVKQHS